MSRCASCNAAIEWFPTRTGASIALEVGTTPGANVRVEQGVAVVVGDASGDRVAHFAYCPHAASWRRRR